MIEINLLPESLREVERTPFPRLITILVGLILFLLISYMAGKEYLVDMVELNAQISRIEDFKKADTTIKSLKRVENLEKEIKEKRQRKEILLQIANAKIMWSKRLDMLNATIHENFNKTLWFDGVTISPTQKPDFLKSDLPITMKLTTKGYLMLKKEEENVGASVALMQTYLKNTFANEIDTEKFKISSYTVTQNTDINRQIVEFPLEITFLPKIYLPKKVNK